MIEHPWTGAFLRANKIVSSELDLRALAICEAWLIWADPFNVRPDSVLIKQFETGDAASLSDIARQLSAKLVRNCPVPLPMQPSATIIELTEGDRSGSLEPTGASPFDFRRGPTP